MRAADADLVERDPALPGLATLLDDEVLGRWLAAAGWSGGRRRYLRYKPGTSCVLGLDVETDEGTTAAVLTCVAAGSVPKLQKTRRRAPGGSVLAADPAAGLLLTTAAADRDLPAVAALAAPEDRAAVLRRLLPGRQPASATISPLRHKPARRWVAVLQAAGEEPLLLRAYRPAVAATVVEALDALGTARVRTPRLVAGDLELGLLVLEFLPGEALSEVAAATGGSEAQWRAVGKTLAQLHQHPAPGLRRRPAGAAGEAVCDSADLVSRLLPAQARRAQVLAGRIAARIRVPAGVRVCHGDFSTDQVIVGPPGSSGVALADLDEVALDDPVTDLGSLVAAERMPAADPSAQGATDLAPLLAGYGTIRALPPADQLAVHTAAGLMRRAPEPFRLAAPRWDADVVRALDAAEAALG